MNPYISFKAVLLLINMGINQIDLPLHLYVLLFLSFKEFVFAFNPISNFLLMNHLVQRLSRHAYLEFLMNVFEVLYYA